VERDDGSVVPGKDEKPESILQRVLDDLILNGFEPILSWKDPGSQSTEKEKPNG